MITVKQIERWWRMGAYTRIVQEILPKRPEFCERLLFATSDALGAAAWIVIRLEELTQSHQPFAREMIRVILAGQHSDGSWGDPVVSALCLRALLSNMGQGRAIELGISHLSAIQHQDGPWPIGAIRRMDEDPFGSAFILMSLSEFDLFRSSVRLEEAINWFHEHEDRLDVPTAKLWAMAWRRWLTTEIRVVKERLVQSNVDLPF